MTKHTILFLAANPVGTDRLALDREARAIQIELERSGHRDHFELVTRWAAEPLDLLRELRKLKPTVVHFSGHGGHGEPGESRQDESPHREVVGANGLVEREQRRGLFFQGRDCRPQLVSTEALEKTFGAVGSSVKLVVLNACYSDEQAQALLTYVDCVVGMRGSIRDDALQSGSTEELESGNRLAMHIGKDSPRSISNGCPIVRCRSSEPGMASTRTNSSFHRQTGLSRGGWLSRFSVPRPRRVGLS